MSIDFENDLRARLEHAAQRMPLQHPEWAGPTVVEVVPITAARSRRWMTTGLVAASVVAIGGVALAVGRSTESTGSLASTPGVDTMSPSTAPVLPVEPTVNAAVDVICETEGTQMTTGSGVLGNEDRAIAEAFTGVVVEGCVSVVVRQGPQATVKVTADDNVLPLISTAVADGNLVVTQTGSFQTATAPVVEVVLPTLTNVDIDGTGDATIADVDAESLSVTVGGTGSVTATGAVGTLDITLDGAADIDTSQLVAVSATVSLNGAGEIVVYAETASATINGAGEIRFVNASAVINALVNGAGEIIDANGNVVGSLELDVDMPEIDLPDVDVPDVELPEIDVPDIDVPEIDVPEITIPDVTIPDVTIPDITFPDLDAANEQLQRELEAMQAELDAELAELEAELDALGG
jgi:hypothetical protein